MKQYLKILPWIIVIGLLVLAVLVLFTKYMSTIRAEIGQLTWDEYQDYISMVNHEITRQGGSVTFQNINSEKTLMKAMHALIRSRAVDARDAHIRGKALEMAEYDNFRKGLMQKVEAQL